MNEIQNINIYEQKTFKFVSKSFYIFALFIFLRTKWQTSSMTTQLKTFVFYMNIKKNKNPAVFSAY